MTMHIDSSTSFGGHPVSGSDPIEWLLFGGNFISSGPRKGPLAHEFLEYFNAFGGPPNGWQPGDNSITNRSIPQNPIIYSGDIYFYFGGKF